ncbi:tRNA dimethylallyltransferase-like isoform X1 [Centruroides sculpturatus]|uniref:tRNA dimethylallyltransferase-like isoform X1 n=1 Tax=Centruroides sculpturatus TaxID=218467 RepID=UPI000C6DECFB|nr:tRNA dimethylallyltransferase-like isoform X1 [Centruroides sculpturatus]
MNILRMTSSNKLPIVVVIGATGCGKSKLAIELAKIFNGEVISADSMQVYKGLDIITNKATKEEQQGIPHHLLDFVNPFKRFMITDFSNLALPLIDNIIQRKKLPIIVGGTNYYIESLLWKVLVPKELVDNSFCGSSQEENININSNSTFEKNNSNSFNNNLPEDKISDIQNVKKIFQVPIDFDTLDNISSQELHDMLRIIDPKMANTLHPNDRRKIIRSLQIYQQQGVTHSQLLEEQKTESGSSCYGGPLRFKNTCILFIQCKQNVLNERLDSRVDDMIKMGLIEEIQGFYKDYRNYTTSNNILPDYTYGIFQSIGFKEFHKYLMLPDDEKETEAGKKLFAEGLFMMKLVTKRYSRKQLKWIRNRFLKQERNAPPVYGLDATNLSLWKEKVLDPATIVVNALLKEHRPPIEPLPIIQTQANIKQLFFCDLCQKSVVGTMVWEKHLKSRKHAKMKKRVAMEQQK